MARTRILLDDELFCLDVVPGWERSLGMRFDWDDFARAFTVGDVWAIVEKHLMAGLGDHPTGLTIACATQRTFYRMRRDLVARGVERAALVPRTPLPALFPWRHRPRLWRLWQEQSGLPLPALRVPVPVFAALWAGSTAGLWAVAPAWGQAIVAGLAMACVLAPLSLVRRALPAATLGELTTQLVTAHYRVLSHPYLRNNRLEVRDLVLAGLARCGVERTAIDPDELRDGTELAWQ